MHPLTHPFGTLEHSKGLDFGDVRKTPKASIAHTASPSIPKHELTFASTHTNRQLHPRGLLQGRAGTSPPLNPDPSPPMHARTPAGSSTQACTRTHRLTHTHTHTHTHLHTRTHAHTHPHTHAHAHTHTRQQVAPPSTLSTQPHQALLQGSPIRWYHAEAPSKAVAPGGHHRAGITGRSPARQSSDSPDPERRSPSGNTARASTGASWPSRVITHLPPLHTQMVLHGCASVCVCACVLCLCASMYVCAWVFARTHAGVCVCVHVCLHVYMLSARMCKCVCIRGRLT